MKHFIRLEESLCQDNRLTFQFSSSLPVFHKKSFFVEYDEALRAPESIQTIPFVAVMMPIAWAAGSDLILPSLDETYAESLERSSRYFEKWFSRKWSFKSSLDAFPVRNSFSPTRRAMLFSSGLDSLTTYIHHKDKKPLLFTIFGADIPLSHTAFIAVCKEKFDDFAKKESVSIQYIHTDARDILNLARLKPYAKNWYGEVAHGLMMSSLVAPAAHHTVKTLFIASCSHRPGASYPCGSEKELVESIQWAGTDVRSDNHELNRCQKIRVYFKPNEFYYSYLRVCWMQFKTLNCGRCEKCLRTICELLINNIDPALCNFKIDNDTLPLLKKRMLNQYYVFFRGENALDFWRTIQENIRLDELGDGYGAREFFRWFAGFEKIKKRQSPLLLGLFYGLMHARALAGKWARPLKDRFKKIREEGIALKEDVLRKVPL